ncbi:unnamed protein product [Paramecium octaurelia]|uniref:Protein kinase domain-containing protein n=1 Tax=Paramecium octaurelia TaxID=43137 RepID=A0A8S1WYE9_PAROT|nr:unnamed protein product [Paramecium octaurelia]
MKKLSLLNIGQLLNQNQKTSVTHHSQEQSKKFSSFDLITKSPYKNSINKQHLRHHAKDYFPITTRQHEFQSIKSPSQTTKASKQFSITNALSQLYKDEVKQPGSSRRTSKKNYTYQLKNILVKDKLSPFDIGQRIATQVTQPNIPQSPKTNLKTSPDVRSIYGDNNKQKLSSKQKSQNTTERMLQLETTRQKIIALQLKIQGNIQQRSQRNVNKNNLFDEKKQQLSQSIQQTIQQQLQKPQLPQNAVTVLKHYLDQLSDYEKKEIIDYETIYYLPPKNIRLLNQDPNEDQQYNNGFDNSNGDYKFVKQDQIAYRYEMLEKLGHGSFGYVFKVHDHKHKQNTALKIIKNKEKFYNQALIEIEILKVINKADPTCCLIKMLNYFEFRGHICLVFELLSCNLYEFIAINEFSGFDLDLIRRFAIQILQALLFMKEQNIIHCDLKPENVLLKDFNRSGIKVIDFGSSCFANQKLYTYIQSRFYRAPEIVLGLPYSTQIDMWSFGCIVAELFTGQSLFQSKSEKELLYLQIKVIGHPDKQLLDHSTRKSKFFDEQLQLNYIINELDLIQQIKPLSQLLDKSSEQFQDFVQKCLMWDPKQRMTPEEALTHPWIIDGLPQSIKKQHLSQMKHYRQLQTEGNLDYLKQSQGQGEQLE